MTRLLWEDDADDRAAARQAERMRRQRWADEVPADVRWRMPLATWASDDDEEDETDD